MHLSPKKGLDLNMRSSAVAAVVAAVASPGVAGPRVGNPGNSDSLPEVGHASSPDPRRRAPAVQPHLYLPCLSGGSRKDPAEVLHASIQAHVGHMARPSERGPSRCPASTRTVVTPLRQTPASGLAVASRTPPRRALTPAPPLRPPPHTHCGSQTKAWVFGLCSQPPAQDTARAQRH